MFLISCIIVLISKDWSQVLQSTFLGLMMPHAKRKRRAPSVWLAPVNVSL